MSKLSDIRPTIDVTLSGGCKVTMFTSLTVADQRELEAKYGDLKKLEGDNKNAFAVEAVLKMIRSWDLVDDDEKAVLPTVDLLSKFPQSDLTLILESAQKKAEAAAQQN